MRSPASAAVNVIVREDTAKLLDEAKHAAANAQTDRLRTEVRDRRIISFFACAGLEELRFMLLPVRWRIDGRYV